MKKKKIVLNIMLLALLLLAFGQISFAEDIEIVENPEIQTEEFEITEEPEKTVVSVKLDYDVLLTLDENGIIVSAELDEKLEGEEVTTLEVDVIGVTLVEGIEKLVEEHNSELDLSDELDEDKDDEEQNELEIEVEIYSEDDELAKKLTELVELAFGENVEVSAENLVDELESNLFNELNPNLERFKLAEQYGITNGKMNLILKLKNSYGEDFVFNYDEWVGKSVKDIAKEIKVNRNTKITEDETQIDEEIISQEDSESNDKEDDKNNGKPEDKDKYKDKDKDKDKDEDKGKGKGKGNGK